MKPIVDARDQRDMLAADWAARLATGPLPTDRAVEMQRWLSLDPRHRGALIRAQAALAALSGRNMADAAPVAAPRRGIGRRAVLAGSAACALAGMFFALRPSPGLEHWFPAQDPSTSAAALVAANPELRWANTVHRGYSRVDITPQAAQLQWWWSAPIKNHLGNAFEMFNNSAFDGCSGS